MQIFEKSIFENNGSSVFLKKNIYKDAHPIHMHDFVEVVYVVKGKAVQTVDGKDYHVSRGDLIIINYNQTHSYRVEEEITVYNLFLDSSFFENINAEHQSMMDIMLLGAFGEFGERFMLKSFVHFSGDEAKEIEGIFKTLYREQSGRKEGSRAVKEMYAAILMINVFRKMTEQISLSDDVNVSIEEITRFVEQNCTEKLSLKELADKCFYNPSYFSRAFKKQNGITLIDFIHTHRIEKACELLFSTDLSVEEIAEKTGYTDKSSFYIHFKRIKGCLPKECKMQNAKCKIKE